MIDFPSRKAKESIKTALALTLAYGLALSWNWDRPMWAGFAIIFCSLTTIGQSISKATLRMCGTLMAATFALLFIALFPQDRWGFMMALSCFLGICTYMMLGKKANYFWNVSGFVGVIICMDTGSDPNNAFSTAVLRVQETGLGILIYSLVSLFLWPISSRSGFMSSATSLATAQQQLVAASLERITQPETADKIPALKGQVLQGQVQFAQVLGAAIADTVEVGEQREAWQRYRDLLFGLTKKLERWNQSYDEIQDLDLTKLLPNLSAFSAEQNKRLVEIGPMLNGTEPKHQPESVALALDQSELNTLSYFQRAAVTVAWQRLKELDQLSQKLFTQVGGINGFAEITDTVTQKPKSPVVFDLDRALCGGRAMMIIWMVYLFKIYVPGVPGGNALVTMGGALGMAIASMPQVRTTKLIVPAAGGIGFAGVLYLCVMPHLSSYLGLGLLIFGAVFVLCYLFYDPRQMLGRSFGLAFFVIIISVSNQQHYSFIGVSSPAVILPVAFVVFWITANIPFSARPERVMLRLLRRFFRSYDALLASAVGAGQSSSWMARQRRQFHLSEVAALPAKLRTWLPGVNGQQLEGSAPEHIQAVLTDVQALSFRMTELLEERRQFQNPELEQELESDFLEWRQHVQGVAQQLSVDPASGDSAQFVAGLTGIRERIEARLGKLSSDPNGAVYGEHDAEGFYRTLGAFHGLSDALVSYTGNTGKINWTPWREERFY